MVDVDDLTVGIAHLHHPVLTLGPGRRAGIWFQGCSIRCPGCVAKDTWDPASRQDRVPLGTVTDWLQGLPAGDIDGITISGGEPFDQPEALAALVAWARRTFDPSAVDILVYTGYTAAVVTRRHAQVLVNVDVVITEPFRDVAGPQLRWRGSPNQQMLLLSPQAARRYAAHRDAPADTGLQFDVRDGRLRFIGVPQPGELQRIEEGLASRGVVIDDSSWT